MRILRLLSVVLAYSETGKFAAKLATKNESIKALFLMDPVDGTPPFSSPRRFPIFLDGNFPTLNIPVTLLESEYGPKFRRLGHSCVPQEMGPARFVRHISPESLERVFMSGLGHADFLMRSGVHLVELMCGSGPEPEDQTFARVRAEWRRFLIGVRSTL